jgi:hypothetical protein
MKAMFLQKWHCWGGWRMEDGGWRMEDGGWRMENGEWRMENGEWYNDLKYIDTNGNQSF